jgi:phosphatidylserine/phosphatidylglycerophosphate/cardiolipin synthase-like enzyme
MKKIGLTHKRIIRFLLLAGILLALGAGFVYRASAHPDASTASSAALTGNIALYFSRPQGLNGARTGGPDQYVARSIENATCCIDIAVYDLDLLSIARALVRAAQRGVTVRIVTDSDNVGGEAIAMLQGVGVPIVGDRRSALMHDKFIVLDRLQLWAGSMNLTVNDAYLNDNNFFQIDSPALAEVFEGEFEEMFTHHLFGAGPAGESGGPVSLGDGCTVQPFFAPDDSPAGALIARIQSARHSIHFMAFSFTSQDISAALQSARNRGVSVQGVVERTQAESNQGAQFFPLRSAGMDIRMDGNPRNMHHKVMLFDGETIVTGSYNFTASAENNNDEDMMIFLCPSAAAQFEMEFRHVFASGASTADISRN